MDFRERIARRSALELENGSVVNLGFGMPNATANFIPKEVNVILQTENGALCIGATPYPGKQDADVANSGSGPTSLLPGAAIFDISTSFGIIRGGHVDAAILGALEVDQEGNIANWATPLAPGKYAPGMGGAMDLVVGARKVVAILKHTDKKGESKVLKKCSLPLTGKGVVQIIITELAVFHVNPAGLELKELAPEISVDQLRKMTDAEFSVAGDLQEYRLA